MLTNSNTKLLLTLTLTLLALPLCSPNTFPIGTVIPNFPIHTYRTLSESSEIYYIIQGRYVGNFDFNIMDNPNIESATSYVCPGNVCKMQYPWGIVQVDFVSYFKASYDLTPIVIKYGLTVAGQPTKSVMMLGQNTRQGLVINVPTRCRYATFTASTLNTASIGFYSPSKIPSVTDFTTDYTYTVTPSTSFQIFLNQTGQWWMIVQDMRTEQQFYTINTTGLFSIECRIVCGDGIVHTGEECDDGNAVDGDSCSNACKLNQKEEVIVVSRNVALIIGLCVGLGVVFCIVLIIAIVCIVRRKKRRQQEKKIFNINLPADSTTIAVSDQIGGPNVIIAKC